MSIPLCTYRIQLHKDITFDDAAEQVEYLNQCGISHIYASPFLQAAQGSTHGYDVVDHSQINKELGGDKAFGWLSRKLKDKNMGLVMDIVPNHMAIHGPENKWWWDVLENGPSSSYATYFDVDWEYPQDKQGNRILLPVLGDHYGKICEKKEITVERKENDFLIRYYDYIFPAAPKSLIEILMPVFNKIKSDELGFIISALHYLPNPDLTDRVKTRRRRRDKKILLDLLDRIIKEQPAIRKLIDKELEILNAQTDRMDRFLELQNYRLAYWKLSRTDLGYRRFFDINNLVALRMEDDDVFSDTHALIFKLIEDKSVDGVRIDHPDGLLDPEGYFTRLRKKTGDIWIIAEKILNRDEFLRPSWPVHGTTGYDFLNRVGGLFIDPEGEHMLNDFYIRYSGEQRDYATILYEKKKQVMRDILASDVNRLAEHMYRLCALNRMYRDFGREEVKSTITEYIAWLPVYRTYIRDEEQDTSFDIDKRIIEETIAQSKKMSNDMDPLLFDFLHDILTLAYDGKGEKDFALCLQQLTGPVMAKGAEDTAFYCYNRFVMLNEVGGDPSKFGTSSEEFHNDMAYKADKFPHTMLTTSTHDTKRSEDVRTRLAVISEIPEQWTLYVEKCSENNERFRKDGIPDKNMEYLLYQTIVGAWPITKERLLPFAEKASREAKIYTSWAQPNTHYEEMCQQFITSILDDETFLDDTESFVSGILYAGRINSLSQLLIKLTAPGVPDMYQGTELWDLSLVDPDNRRPCDFKKRRDLLSKCATMNCGNVMKHMDEGLPKLWLLYKTMNHKKQHPLMFQRQPYAAIEVYGNKASHVIAFMRGNHLITAVPRLSIKRGNDWGDTGINIPEGDWRNIFDDRLYSHPSIHADDLFKDFPVALLYREKESDAS